VTTGPNCDSGGGARTNLCGGTAWRPGVDRAARVALALSRLVSSPVVLTGASTHSCPATTNLRTRPIPSGNLTLPSICTRDQKCSAARAGTRRLGFDDDLSHALAPTRRPSLREQKRPNDRRNPRQPPSRLATDKADRRLEQASSSHFPPPTPPPPLVLSKRH
jgi:hypothetical protein